MNPITLGGIIVALLIVATFAIGAAYIVGHWKGYAKGEREGGRRALEQGRRAERRDEAIDPLLG